MYDRKFGNAFSIHRFEKSKTIDTHFADNPIIMAKGSNYVYYTLRKLDKEHDKWGLTTNTKKNRMYYSWWWWILVI